MKVFNRYMWNSLKYEKVQESPQSFKNSYLGSEQKEFLFQVIFYMKIGKEKKNF